MLFSAFKDKHKGETVLVCGCGRSLNQLTELKPNCITVGVNDVGRLIQPDYLVVLNSKAQFRENRFQYVLNSEVDVVFSQLNLPLPSQRLVKFKLANYGGTECNGESGLPYTRNSPYVAVCLAAFMGAKRIGVIGVDFTEHHFFGKTGKHRLHDSLKIIDQEYAVLHAALDTQGVELVNTSSDSALRSLPKTTLKEFLAISQAVDNSRPIQSKTRARKGVKVEIQRCGDFLIERFMDAMADTCHSLGYIVSRNVSPLKHDDKLVRMVWNGRRYSDTRNMVFCEHGWLPRDAYQISTRGINADSHVAGFVWDGQPPNTTEKMGVENYLDALRNRQDFNCEYMKTAGPGAEHLPEQFLLVPLQIEGDTNLVRHVAPHLKTMQSFVNFISHANPPWPIVFKQHPADLKRGSQQMRLRLLRKQDQLRCHNDGNIHQILKSARCIGVISLNSNVVHDTFLWNVPAIVLGKNIWPQKGISPFLVGLPGDWDRLPQFLDNPAVRHCQTKYIQHIIHQQWLLDDANDPEKVNRLVNSALSQSASGFCKVKVRRVRPENVVVNVVAKNKGWLFEDLKRQFSSLRLPAVKIIVSERPLNCAYRWIALRVSELDSIPDLSRTLVQLHDNQSGLLYDIGAARYRVRDCGAICMTHPTQQKILESKGIELNAKPRMLRPLGFHKSFTLKQKSNASKFNVAWVGRPVMRNGEDQKRLQWFVDALKCTVQTEPFRITLLGDRLDQCAGQVRRLGFDCHYFSRKNTSYSDYPRIYQDIDCVVITSMDAAGPNCLYEALACGIPVVSTRCGWVDSLVKNAVNGYIVNSPEEIFMAIEKIRVARKAWFDRRDQIRASVEAYSLHQWLLDNVKCVLDIGKWRMSGNMGKPVALAM